MLRMLGSAKRLCDGFSRRDLLQIGGLGALGLNLDQSLALESLAAPPTQSTSFGKAKACILLYLFGAPPQHETFDPKPDAPVEIQGEMRATATNVPGIAICERLPKIAQVADRLTIVRSLTHPYPLHGVAYALTGMPTYTPANEANPRAPEFWPFIGSAVDYLEHQRTGGVASAVPRNLGLPWQFGSKSTLPTLAGPYAGFLGPAFDPVWTNFEGRGTRVVPKLTDAQTQEVRDPFAGIEPTGRFRAPGVSTATDDLSLERWGLRRSLLQQFDHARALLGSSATIASYDQQRQLAWSLLTSGRVRDALDIGREPASTRDPFGMTLFGQSCLAARRLIEAGCKFVSVFWDPFEPFGGSCWDTHANHYPRLKEYLLPVFDDAYAALIRDLETHGLLDETLVLCLSEHGRTPTIDSKPKGAARHHWSRVYSAVFAGGGMGRGQVVGRSDRTGGEVAQTSISPKDILATTLHLLGIDAETTVPDRLGRRVRAAGDGHVRGELLA